MPSYVDKVVVVTGAGSGIGRSSALAFARRGADVHIVDVDPVRAQSVAEECRGLDRPAWAHAVDCADPAAMTALASKIYDQSGAVHVLHNNAGIGHAAPVEQVSMEDWHRVLSVNLFGPVHGVAAFVPRMLEQERDWTGRRGHIVNTASVLGLVAAPGMAPYCTSKFGLVGLSEALAAELEPQGISVTAICPGVIATNIIREAPLGDGFEGRRDETASFYERYGATPEDVAEDIIAAISARRVIAPSPMHQVLPLWWLKRASIPAYRGLQRVFRRVMMERSP
jgi:NAD(P)-dependent dehydrogenase (short-subunit alcohol dehydrogenase family)